MAETKGSGDPVTDQRVSQGQKPDVVGWKSVAHVLGVSERTARDWEERYHLPIVWWGSYAAAYADRLRVCALSLRRRTA